VVLTSGKKVQLRLQDYLKAAAAHLDAGEVETKALVELLHAVLENLGAAVNTSCVVHFMDSTETRSGVFRIEHDADAGNVRLRFYNYVKEGELSAAYNCAHVICGVGLQLPVTDKALLPSLKDGVIAVVLGGRKIKSVKTGKG
jgi:hypothetical protein